MNVNYVVTFKRHPQVTFDIEICSDIPSYDSMMYVIQMQAFICLLQNALDTKKVLQISATADFTNTRCKKHGLSPSAFVEVIETIFYYNEEHGMNKMFGKIFNLTEIKRRTESKQMPLVAQAYIVDQKLVKDAS